MHNYDVVLREALFPKSKELAQLFETVKKKPGFSRFQFIEVLFRLSRLVYAT